MKNILSLVFSILLLVSCEKEKQNPSSTPNSIESGGVFVSCEGNFQAGNSTIAYYNPLKGTTTSNFYETVNGQPLGDICQSMNIMNGKFYAVVNNSGKIEVCNLSTMKRISTITGLTSPRYIVQTGASKAYVSDTYSNSVSVVDLNSSQVTGTIPINGWTEQMLMINNSVYITNVNTEYIYIADALADTLTDSIHISKGGSTIVKDVNGKLWVLCGGDYLQTYIATLYRIDPSTKQVELALPFSSTDFPSRLCINGTSDMLYFLNAGVFRMSINDSQLPATAFIPGTSGNFYGLGIHPISGDVYVSDAIDFVQQGKVLRYSSAGTLSSDFTVGIIPGDFLFVP